MNLFAFALIVAVDIVLKEELLTYALIVWGTLLVGRFMWRLYIKNNYPETKTGRNSY